MQNTCPFLNEQANEPLSQGPPPQYEEEGISLRELLLVLWRGKKTIALIAAVVFLLGILGATIIPQIEIGTKGTVQTAVKLYFTGIEVGQTPSGTNYDINEMKSAEVLRNAIDSMDLGNRSISLEALKANITFQAVVPDNVAKTLKDLEGVKDDALKMETLQNLESFPNVFVVKLNLSNSLGINEEEGRVLLDSIVFAYKKQLIKDYGEEQVLADVFADDLDLTKYDYIESANILNGQLQRMENFVQNRMTKTTVQSTVTGMNPEDLESALVSIRTVDMERIFTLIGTYYLTKDAEKTVAVYEQLVENKQKEAAQYQEEAAVIKAALQGFKKDESAIVLGGDKSGVPITLQSENKQYNEFVTQYIIAGTNGANAREDANYYASEAERFRGAIS
ncbi:MAG: hypothetical protein PHC40_07655, partial [Eubacteriales bacterium]|nr:hypothetical protein [Eubacteriales bacterium]